VGVNYKNPPWSTAFKEFYPLHNEVHPIGQLPVAPRNPISMDPMVPQFQAPLLNALAMALLSSLPVTSVSPKTDIEPANVAVICKYPEVGNFFAKLAEENPWRNLDNIGEKPANQDFFCIDEITYEDEIFYQMCPYSLSQGNTKFVVKSIREAVEAAK
jgi:hypothetical protein